MALRDIDRKAIAEGVRIIERDGINATEITVATELHRLFGGRDCTDWVCHANDAGAEYERKRAQLHSRIEAQRIACQQERLRRRPLRLPASPMSP